MFADNEVNLVENNSISVDKSYMSKRSGKRMDPQKVKDQRKKKFYIEGLLDLDSAENQEDLERKMSPEY